MVRECCTQPRPDVLNRARFDVDDRVETGIRVPDRVFKMLDASGESSDEGLLVGPALRNARGLVLTHLLPSRYANTGCGIHGFLSRLLLAFQDQRDGHRVPPTRTRSRDARLVHRVGNGAESSAPLTKPQDSVHRRSLGLVWHKTPRLVNSIPERGRSGR